jgi:hypothetical protein
LSGPDLTGWHLEGCKLRDGVWTAQLTGGLDRPDIAVHHQGHPVHGVTVSGPGPDWRLEVPVPAEALSDGVQILIVTDAMTGHWLGALTLIAGEVAGEDLRAEVALLRAELDMLKRAFRRHCAETD